MCCRAEEYNKTEMAAFDNEPLLCEAYAYDEGIDLFAAVQCPHPTALHRFTRLQWPENTAGLHCDSNNDQACADDGNPLTKSVVNGVLQTLDVGSTAERVIANANAFASCDASRQTLSNIQSEHCEGLDLRMALLLTWALLAAAGLVAALLFVALLVAQRTSSPARAKATVFNAVYGPGTPHTRPCPGLLIDVTCTDA